MTQPQPDSTSLSSAPTHTESCSSTAFQSPNVRRYTFGPWVADALGWASFNGVTAHIRAAGIPPVGEWGMSPVYRTADVVVAFGITPKSFSAEQQPKIRFNAEEMAANQ